MDTSGIIADIDTEIAKLRQARAILMGESIKKTGRPKSTTRIPKTIKGKMSLQGKARIAAAQKARWAKIKRSVKVK